MLFEQTHPDTEESCSTSRTQPSSVFSRLPDLELERYLQMVQLRYYDRGTTIAKQGEAAQGVIVNLSARIKLEHFHSTGKCTAVSFVQPGGVIGLAQILLGSRYQRRVTVVEAGEVEYVPKREMVQFILGYPSVAIEMLVLASQQHQELLEDLCRLSADPPEQRLVRTLMEFAEPDAETRRGEVHLQLPVTVQDVADRIGCSRQWTSKILTDLEDRGWIRRRGRSVALLAKALRLVHPSS